MSQTFFNQLTDLNDAKDGVKDYIFVNRWRGIGAPNFANAAGWETTQVNVDQYLALVLASIDNAQDDATDALQWTASPLSDQVGNQAFLVNGKIFVPAPAPPAVDFKTIATISTPVTIANTTAETIFPTNLPIAPADNLVGALYELHFNISKGPAGHSSIIRIYINTSPTIGGTKVLETTTSFNSNTSFSPFYRYFRNSIGLVVPRDVNAAQIVFSNIQTQSLVSTTPITFSNTDTYYFVITTQMNINNSTETLQFAKLCLTK